MTPETIHFAGNDRVPNNPRLPVLHYHGALQSCTGSTSPEAAEAMLTGNGWPAAWRAGIFPYHHYHSTAHEVLAVVSGKASVMLGGPDGPAVTLQIGDVVVLPAGTGHCRMSASPDFLVVGGYPEGQDVDLCRDPADDAVRQRIREVPVPATDPVSGKGGPLAGLWQAR